MVFPGRVEEIFTKIGGLDFKLQPSSSYTHFESLAKLSSFIENELNQISANKTIPQFLLNSQTVYKSVYEQLKIFEKSHTEEELDRVKPNLLGMKNKLLEPDILSTETLFTR
jgi:hypothetical protein